jgi:mRNA interferase RelE/StbE
MTYELLFHPDALDEWGKIDKAVREQFKKKLAERLLDPHVPSARLSGQKSRYKIKLRSVGYRLVYEVVDVQLIVTVVAVGKRERNAVYKVAAMRKAPHGG